MDTGAMISTFFQSGGIAAWVLLLLALVALAVTVERTLGLSRAAIDVNDFFAQVRKALITNRSIREAIKICEQVRGPVPSIVKAGLLKAGHPRAEIESTLQTAALFERGRLERFLSALAAVARVAPLVGLLGAVVGAVRVLGVVAGGGADAGRVVAAGLMAPLIVAAGGLVLAIPAFLVHTWLSSRAARVEREIDTAVNMLLETYAETEQGGALAGPPPAPAGSPLRDPVPSR
jgi:biopolymer transport protein ExbB